MKQSTFSAQVANNLLTVLQGYSKTIRLLLAMFLTLTVSVNAWGAIASGTYVLCTSTSDLEADAHYIIASGISGTVYCISNVSQSNYRERVSATVSNDKITVASNSTIMTFTLGGSTDKWTFYTDNYAGTAGYLASAASGSNNYCRVISTEIEGTISISSNVATIALNPHSARKYLKYNSSASRFACYSSGQADVYLYKLAASCDKKVTIVKGTPETGGSFNLDKTGAQDCCSALTVTVSNITAPSGKEFDAITQSGIATGVTINQSAKTVTYAANSTGTSTINVTFRDLPKYTITLKDNDETLTQSTAGGSVTLPSRDGCDGYEFVGWTKTWNAPQTSWTTTAPNIIPDGSYTPTANESLYPVYTKTEGGGTSYQFQKVTALSQIKAGGTFIITNGSYYLPNAQASSSGPVRANMVTVTNGVVTGAVTDAMKWTFSAADANGKITIKSAANSNYYLYTTSSNNGLRVYTTSDTWTFEEYTVSDILGFAMKSTSNSRYCAVYTDGTDWRSYTTKNAANYETNSGRLDLYKYTEISSSTTSYISVPDCGIIEPSQLATPTGLDVTNLTSTSATLSWGEVANASSYTVFITDLDDEEITLTDIEEASVDVTGLSPETLYLWNVVAIGDGANYTDSEHSSQEDPNAEFTTSAAASPATITLSELGVTSTIDTYSVGAQYTLPTTSSQSCAGKQLVGWSTVEVAEIDTKPTSNYYELGAEVTLAATQTFYAVFAAGSGGGGETWTLVKDVNDLAVGDEIVIAASDYDYALSTTQNGNNRGQAAVTKNEETITFGNDVQVLTLQTGNVSNLFAFYTGSGYLYAASSSSNYLRTENTLSNNSSWNIEITDAGVATITARGTNTKNLLRYNSSSSIFSCYSSGQLDVSIYKKAGGGGYTAYSTSCIPTYSITYDFAGGTGSHCPNTTSVPQGNPYTICDEEPTKDGHTFQGWSDGTSTYDGGATFTPTKNTTLTAVWKANTYTVTWNNNGDTDEVTYNHGVALVVPEAPESCDGVKEFVGWTTHSGYYHATTAPDDIFTTKTTPVTATATYYAVFATKGAGGTEFVLGESGTFKMYANVNGTNYYAQGGVSSSQITSTTNALSASDYTLTYAKGSYTIQQGTSDIGHGSDTSLSSTSSTWTISEGTNGSWRVQSKKDESRALSYSSSANAFKAYATSNITAGDDTYFDIEFGTGSSGYSDYTTTCQQVESIEVQSPQTEFYLTDDFTIGTGKVIATLSGGGTTDVTGLAHFSGYNMEATGTQTVTVTYMGATATYEITVKPLDNAWVLTWNVSGKTNTGLGPRSVTKGNAIGTLPVPEVPAACAGKTFMGWTESNIVPSDGKGIVYITEETVPTKNTTYYAVFATINNFSTQAAIEDIESGSKVVIVAVASMDASGGAGQAISSRTISITSQGVIGLSGDEVSIFDETINTPHSTCIWTLTKEGGGIVFEQGGKYIRAVNNGYRRLLLETTKDYWTLSPVGGKDKTYHMQSGNTSHYVEWFDHTDSKYAEGERYIGFVPYTEANDNGDFDMQFYVTANADGNADITDYTTGCAEYTITYYGFHGGYSTSCSSDGTIVLPVNSIHTIPDCEGLVINDHTNLGREFLNVWMTQPHGGHTFKPGDTFILTQDTTLYAQWKMETTSDVTTLPTDIEDLAGTDIYVYGGTTLNIQPGTTTINSLTLKGGLQADGSYKMPTVWVPEGATLVRNSNKINLDLIVNAKTWYPFAVPFAAKNNANVEYLDPVLAAASYYGTHFAIKTYDGARRAKVGEDKANNWVRVLRDSTLQPGVGYIITALTYPDKDTATIRIPMTVPNTWFKNGEQAAVNTTVRNTIAVTAHAGDAATEHQRHAGWNFVANPYLTSFAGGNVANDGDLAYINGELIIAGSYEYTDEEVPYVTVPAYDFAYYSQHKLSEVKLSPEWSFFVQVGNGGTMNFTTAGRQQAPASIAARNAEERPVKMDVDLILSDNHSSDQTGLIICDRYSDAYEIGRDLEKLFGSAYNLSVYTLMEDNTPLAFQALAIRSSMQVIPVGYRAPEQGEYTFRLNEATSSIDLLNEQYEQLVLVDYQTGELTNLLYTDYTFYSERTQSNSRFAIYAVPRQNAPTDLPNAIGSDEEVRKVIYNDHLYILRDGNVYNGMGQKM